MEFKQAPTRKRARLAVVHAPRRRRQVPFRRSPVKEIKFHDLDVDDAAIATGGTIAEDSLLTIAEGIGEEQRIGRKITVVSIHMNWDLLLAASAGSNTTTDSVRVILYWDKQTNGAAPVILDLLEIADWQSFRNISNAQRFVFLLDRMVTLVAKSGSGRGTTDTLSFGEDAKHFRYNKNVNIPIIYDDSSAGGAITSMCCSNLGILTISKGGLTAFGSRVRIRYSDA